MTTRPTKQTASGSESACRIRASISPGESRGPMPPAKSKTPLTRCKSHAAETRTSPMLATRRAEGRRMGASYRRRPEGVARRAACPPCLASGASPTNFSGDIFRPPGRVERDATVTRGGCEVRTPPPASASPRVRGTPRRIVGVVGLSRPLEGALPSHLPLKARLGTTSRSEAARTAPARWAAVSRGVMRSASAAASLSAAMAGVSRNACAIGGAAVRSERHAL